MTPDRAAALDALRAYLDRVGFQQIYKFIVSVSQYGVAPSMITRQTAGAVERFFDTVLANRTGLALLQCLMIGRPAARRSLTALETEVADALVRADLLRDAMDGAMIVHADRQLIAAFGVDLLIDRRIHFGGEVHEVYIGPDSFWMLYYLDGAALRRGQRAVDLCTGTGIAALYLASFCDRVTATDIGDAPLQLAAINRRLNGRDETIEIRPEDLRDTLDGPERYDVLTCNPPFVAVPPGLKSTLYAQGTDTDGLGYLRTIIERLPAVMVPGGAAYLVADLVGDRHGPHFVAELAAFAASGRLAVDVYIDHVLPASAQVAPFTSHLARLNAGYAEADIAAVFTAFQSETLRADHYYLSTMRIRTEAPEPGVRVMQRFLPPRHRANETWPPLLLRA